ncbi:hypothetical protein EV426DRAFT_381813 [Tirmania nivea]|nr:hypothetical protein EV426DRAFT_381813 [Tirmania nivea]
MDYLVPDLDLYYLFEHVSQGNEAGTSQTYLPRQPPAGAMDEAPHRSSDSLSMHNSLQSHQHHQHQNLYQPLRAVTTHPYYTSTTASIPSKMYLSDGESPPPIILSSSSPYRVGGPRSSNDIPGPFVGSMEHGSYDNQNTMLSGCETYIKEVLVRSEPDADKVRLPPKQYIGQAYAAQDPSGRAGPVKAGRKKRQETDDELSELESSDSRKTNSDTMRQRGRPRLDIRDETQTERRRTQIRLAQRAYRLRKETTIASLRSRVSELETAIAGMQDAFAELHHATASLTGNNDPTLTTSLGSITERFNTLAQTATMKSCEGGISGDEDADAYVADQSGEETVSSSRRPQSSRIRR